jgi:hypothetical protein
MKNRPIEDVLGDGGCSATVVQPKHVIKIKPRFHERGGETDPGAYDLPY